MTPQPGAAYTPGVYSLMVLEAESPTSRWHGAAFSLSLSSCNLSSACTHAGVSPCVQISSSYKDIKIGLGPHFNSITTSQYSHSEARGRLGLQHMDFEKVGLGGWGGDTIQHNSSVPHVFGF